jgi:deoxyribose-phosphate aldolase
MKVSYDYRELMSMIDSTLLKPTATGEEIEKLCQDALKYGFKAVVVNPIHVKACKKILKDTKVKVSTVAGFPLGEDLTKVKLFEVKRACKEGAEEIDVVTRISAIKSGNWKVIEQEVKKIVKAAAKKRLVKVILEASYLTDEEIERACQICVEAGARFVKTGTGYAGDATVSQVALMSRAVKAQLSEMSNKNDLKHCEVKAAAGIKTYAQALALAEAGATRIGTSRAVEIAEEGVIAAADERFADPPAPPLNWTVETPAESLSEIHGEEDTPILVNAVPPAPESLAETPAAPSNWEVGAAAPQERGEEPQPREE